LGLLADQEKVEPDMSDRRLTVTEVFPEQRDWLVVSLVIEGVPFTTIWRVLGVPSPQALLGVQTTL
jgi:hypothetical protein